MPIDEDLRRSEKSGVVRVILQPRAQLAAQHADGQLDRRIQRCRAHRALQARGNVSQLRWERMDQFAAADPAAYLLLQHLRDRCDGGRPGACFLDGDGPGERQIVDR